MEDCGRVGARGLWEGRTDVSTSKTRTTARWGIRGYECRRDDPVSSRTPGSRVGPAPTVPALTLHLGTLRSRVQEGVLGGLHHTQRTKGKNKFTLFSFSTPSLSVWITGGWYHPLKTDKGNDGTGGTDPTRVTTCYGETCICQSATN